MAQRISQMQTSSDPYAQEALVGSSVERGLGGMTLPNPGVPNSLDGGSFTKVTANPQPERNQALALQHIHQDGVSGAPQMASAAMNQVNTEVTKASDIESKGQQYMNAFMANQMEQAGLGQNILALNDAMSGDRRAKTIQDIAITREMNA